MEIELKNGEKLILDVTPLLLEYIGDYKGGLEQLKRDAQGEKDERGYSKVMYATNQILYSIIASNYDEPLTYRQAVRLVKLEDIERIVDFVIKSTPNINKSTQINTTGHRM